MTTTPLVITPVEISPPTVNIELPTNSFISNEATQAFLASSTQELTDLPDLNVQAAISTVAQQMKVSSSTLYNVAKSESELQADPPGHNDGGKACGVVQVHAKTWGFDCDELKEQPEIGLEFLAKHIKAGDAWKYWTSLNCYVYVSHLVPSLPRMSDIQPNSKLKVGAVAIFYYHDKKTGVIEKHVAYVKSVGTNTFIVKESNFTAGLIGERTIHKNDPYLAGYWSV